MKLQTFKRLIRTDYAEEYQNLIDQLSGSLNSALESMTTAINKNLTLKDNVSCTIKDINVTLLSTGVPKETITINLDFTGQVTAVICGKAENQTNPNIYPTAGVHISYTQNNQKITINHIAGLQAGNVYSLRVLIFA